MSDRPMLPQDPGPGAAGSHGSEAPYRATALSGLPGTAMFVVDAALRYRVAEGGALRAAGLRPSDFVGRTVREVLGAEQAEEYERFYRRALDGEAFESEHVLLGRVYLTRGAPIREADGAVRSALAVSYDITEQRQAERRQTFLLRLADALRPLADPIAVQAEAARLLAEHFQVDRVGYGEADGADGDTFTMHCEHCRPGMPSAAGRHRFDDFGAHVAGELRAGRTVVVADVRATPGHSAAERAAYDALEVGAYVAVPLAKAGRVAACLAVSQRLPRAWTASDAALIQEVAERTWAAVERARSERERADGEALLSAVLDALPVGVIIADAAGRLVRDNAANRALWGVPPDTTGWEQYGEWEGYLPDTGQRIQAHEWAMARALLAGEVVRGEAVECQPFDGGPRRLFLNNAAPVRDAGGRIVGGVAVELDITAQRRVEAAVGRRARQLQALAAATLDIGSAASVDAKLEAVTHAARSIVGAHQGVVSLTRGPDWSQAVSTVSLTERYARWHDYAAVPDGSGIYAWVCEQNRPVRLTQAELQAHPRWRGFGRHAADHPPMRGWLAAPLTAKDGRNLGLIQLSDKADGTDFDEADEAILVQLARFASVSIEQAQAEAALRDSEERLRLAIESSSLGTFDFDVASQTIAMSPQAQRAFGLAQPTNPLAAALAALHPDDARASSEALGRMLDAAGTDDYHLMQRAVHADGTVRYVDVVAKTKFADGADGARRPVRVAGVVRDVTEQHQLIERLRQADRRKDEFLAILAHELRNPLAPLTNALRLLDRQSPADDPQRAVLAIAERQTRQLARLVDDLLEASRITTGKIVLRPEPMTLQTAIHDAIEAAEPQIEARCQRLRCVLPEQPVRIHADPARIAQVLGNLLTNASRYNRTGGSIEVRLQARDEWVEIRVADDGIGIDPAKLPQLFELFTQVGDSANHAHGGLGIGLALVRHLAALHGGSVTAASDGLGKGAVFTVRLARRPPEQAG